MKPNQKRYFWSQISILFPITVIIGYFALLLIFQLRNTDNPSRELVLFFDGFTDRMIQNPESALAAIGDLSAQLGIEDPSAVFSDCQETAAGGNAYYRFAQSYQGIPVYGRSLVVEADQNGTGLLLTGNYLDLGQMETTPQIEQAAAMDAALQLYGQDATVACDGLTIYSLNDSSPELAWQLEVTSDAAQDICFVSAVDGRVLATESLIRREQVLCRGQDLAGHNVSFYAEYQDGVYEMRDDSRQIVVYNANEGTAKYTSVVVDSGGNIYRSKNDQWYDANGQKVTITGQNFSFEICDEAGNVIDTKGEYAIEMRSGLVLNVWEKSQEDRILITRQEQRVLSDSLVWENPEAVTVMSLLKQTCDFWASDLMNRHGFDNQGGTVIATYNDNLNGDTTNAYALPVTAAHMGIISIGEDCSLTLDLVGHEYMHLVTDCVAGLVNGGEAGAIDEALSDIFGEIVEESVNGSCDWQHDKRNLANPRQSRGDAYPDTYQGDNWVFPEDNDSDGGEHMNSTVLSHAAYLMNTGMNADSRYEALSMEDLAQLFYRTLQTLPKDCTFAEFRTLTEHAAQTMERQGMLSSEQVKCVSYAFFQVGIPSTEAIPVAPEVEVTVYGINGLAYENCILYVSDGKTITQYDGADLDHVKVDLSGANSYELLVVDRANPEQQTSQTVTVVPQGGLPSLAISTNCGVVTAEEEIESDSTPDLTPWKTKLSELIQTHGLFEPLQTGSLSIENINEKWLSPCGVMGAQVLDYDLDGDQEMLVCFAERCTEDAYYGASMGASHLVMEIYELEEGQAVCRASQIMGAYNPSPYYESDRKEVLLVPDSTSEDVIGVHTVWSDGRPYIACEYRSFASAFGDGMDQAYWMLEYTGETLRDVCSYTQTEAGSSDFQYMGYQFTDREETDAQLYYSEYYEDTALYNRFGAAIETFFSGYNIQLADWIKNSRDTGDTLQQFQSFLSSGNDMEKLFLYSCQETGFHQDGNVWERQVHEFTAELDRGGDLLDEIAGIGAEDPGENSEPASASEAAAPVDLGALYENDELTVSGTLEERYYEIDTQNTGTVYILQLDKPFTVQLYADWMEYNGETVEIDEIQIDFQNQGLNRFYLNRHINVTGTVMYGHTGHHQTIILLMDAILNTSGS